jgi:carbonic anhydrase/acetyltransferase-like protein (isoleucine patch superfamily)
MILEHDGHSPVIDGSTFVAATATVCGDVVIGKDCRIMYGACIVAEGGKVVIGDRCVVLENAVLRSTARHDLIVGNDVLVGPNAHVVGCRIEENVFIATGASIFHGARLGRNSEVRINGVVHLRTVLPENEIVPIGWVAVGDPARILPPDRHDEIWEIQEPLNFPKSVYGVDRDSVAGTIMPEIVDAMVNALGTHRTDREVPPRSLA